MFRGWEHPVVLDKDGHKTEVLKPEEEWTALEDELALAKSKALNALFNGVDKNMFKLIKKCDVAKDAWDILGTTHEDTVTAHFLLILFFYLFNMCLYVLVCNYLSLGVISLVLVLEGYFGLLVSKGN